jgi:deazaflavin-dependent oxidoreductase (nitroreductase family)
LILNQPTLDRIRRMNKRFLNKLMIHIAGKKFGHFAILSHVGRKSGRLYHIPIITEPLGQAFVFALTYGRKVDWLANVLAAGGCSIRWKNKDISLIHPEFIAKETGLSAFPAFFRSGLTLMGIEGFVRLEIDKNNRNDFSR